MQYKTRVEKYYYVEIEVNDEKQSELLERQAFEEYNCSGVQVFSVEEAKVDEILGARSYSGGDLPQEVIDEVEAVLKAERSKVAFYFHSEEEAQAFYSHAQSSDIDAEVALMSSETQDWNESWKKSFTSIVVSPEMKVIPSWEDGSEDEGIFIYPGMGFGTGNHETTFLCLKLMLELSSREQPLQTCLDFGCGSGILGIGFAWANKEAVLVDYLDIDNAALENCRQNLELNKKARPSAGKLLLRNESDDLRENYDLVFANILLDALIAERDLIVEKTKNYLILSGLLKGQEEEAIAAYLERDPKLRVVKVAERNDWVAALLKRDL